MENPLYMLFEAQIFTVRHDRLDVGVDRVARSTRGLFGGLIIVISSVSRFFLILIYPNISDTLEISASIYIVI